MDRDDEPTQPVTDQDRIEQTVWSVLRVIYLRIILQLTGDSRVPSDLDIDQANDLLADWQAFLETDLDIFTEIMKQARLVGVDSVHRTLHGQPGVDSEMLDEAVEYGTEKT